MEIAFEDLCSRFDRYLGRLRASGDDQRGLVILDNSAYETTLQQMSVEFRTLGTRWGVIRRLADTPLFVDSRASRVIQLADHVAYAVFRRYHAGIRTTLTVSPRSSTRRTALFTGWPTRNWGIPGVCAPLASLGGSTKADGPSCRACRPRRSPFSCCVSPPTAYLSLLPTHDRSLHWCSSRRRV